MFRFHDIISTQEIVHAVYMQWNTKQMRFAKGLMSFSKTF